MKGFVFSVFPCMLTFHSIDIPASRAIQALMGLLFEVAYRYFFSEYLYLGI